MEQKYITLILLKIKKKGTFRVFGQFWPRTTSVTPKRTTSRAAWLYLCAVIFPCTLKHSVHSRNGMWYFIPCECENWPGGWGRSWRSGWPRRSCRQPPCPSDSPDPQETWCERRPADGHSLWSYPASSPSPSQPMHLNARVRHVKQGYYSQIKPVKYWYLKNILKWIM